MQNFLKTRPKSARIIKSIVSLLMYSVVVYGVVWWQQRDMLATDQPITSPELHLLDINGKAFHYQFDNGQTDTLVYFFAPWCNICHLSIDNIESLKNSKLTELTIVAIALDWQSIEEVEAFLAEHQLTMPILLGTRQIQQDFQISAFPSYYLVDKSGNIRAKNKGYTSEIGMTLAINLNR